MPDPIVIIGPASGPAGPIAGPPAPPKPPEDSTADETHERAAGQSSGFQRIAGRLAALAGRGLWVLLVAVARGSGRAAVLLVRGLWAALLAVARTIQQYPRYSLAAGASFLILGSIAYTQSGSGTPGRRSVTTAITGDPTKPPAGASREKHGAASNTAAAGNANTPAAASGKLVAADADKQAPDRDRNAPESGLAAAGQTPDPASLAGGPAPKPAATDEATTPAPALAQAPPSAEKGDPEAAKPSTTADAMRESAFDPVPAPASRDDGGVATLLGGGTEPAPARPAPDHKDGAGGASAAKSATSVDPQLPAPTPPETNPRPPAVSGPAKEPRLALAPPASGRADKTGIPKSAADAHTKDVQRDHDGKPQPPAGPLGQAPPSEPPKDTEENPPAVPARVQSPTAPHELPSDPAAAAPTAKSQAASNEQKPPEPSRPGALDLSPPVLSPQAPPPEPSDPAGKTVVTAAANELPAPTHEAVNKTAENPAPGREPSAARRDDAPAGLEMPAATGAIGTRSASSFTAPNSDQHASSVGEPEPRITSASPGNTPAEPPKRRELGEGWVEIPNSGNLILDDKPEIAERSASSLASAVPESRTGRDRRAHAAKDMAFEPESDEIRARHRAAPDTAPAGASASGRTGAGAEPANTADGGQIESVPHVVEPKENFWTISRLYYSSGRYYRALWKANAAKYPDINVLHVGDVIVIPPVEDLDPADIASPRSRPPAGMSDDARGLAGDGNASRGGGGPELADQSESSSQAADNATSAPRRTRVSGSSGSAPPRRVSMNDPELALPLASSTIRRDRPPARAGRPASDDDTQSDEPETRFAARPRSMAAAPPRRPVYKVRPYDTVRSIARDTLGDARRADEILDLNRDFIDDPSHLVVGQILELPEDARTSVRRAARSR
jgi:nucleoid-associated protein YgaU